MSFEDLIDVIIFKDLIILRKCMKLVKERPDEMRKLKDLKK